MKKNNSKTKSPTPATNGAKPAKKKKTSAATVHVISASQAAPIAERVEVAVATKPQVPAAPAVKAVAPAAVRTRIIARIDVGYGNALYVRGDGAGLTWNQGVPMECVANDQWELTLGESARPVSFKVLLNDSLWCSGPDSVVASGSTMTLTPEFA